MAVSNLIFLCNNSQRLFHLWFQEAEPTLSYLNYLKDWYYLKDGEDKEDAEDEDAGYPVMKVREVRIVKRSQRSDSL